MREISELTRELLSIARTGKKFSEEHKRNIAKAKHKSWEDGKYDHLKTMTPQQRHAKGRHNTCDQLWCDKGI